ncbi:MAG: hypothetical protein IJP88_07910, partial [Synergistaceae bacterium]|nr:hypothetical protein [Synergistaceae bacterium]
QLRDQKFDVFKNYIRHNATIFGAAPTGGVPVVLTYNRADVTWRNIIKPEFEALGQEFMKRAGI